jgi:hypothetical protein
MWLFRGSSEEVDPALERVDPADIGPWRFEEIENALKCSQLSSGVVFVGFFKKMNSRWLERLANPLDTLRQHCCAQGLHDANRGGLSLAMQSLLLVHGDQPIVAACALRVLLSIAAGTPPNLRQMLHDNSAMAASIAAGHTLSARRLYATQCGGLPEAVEDPPAPYFRRLTAEERMQHTIKLATTLTTSKAQEYVLMSCTYAVLSVIGTISLPTISSGDPGGEGKMGMIEAASTIPQSLEWRCEMICSAAQSHHLLLTSSPLAKSTRSRCIGKCSDEVLQLVSSCVASRVQQIAQFLTLTSDFVHPPTHLEDPIVIEEHRADQLRRLFALQSAAWALLRLAGAALHPGDLHVVLQVASTTIHPLHGGQLVWLQHQQFSERQVDVPLTKHFCETVLGVLSSHACRAISITPSSALLSQCATNTRDTAPVIPAVLTSANVTITSRSPVWGCSAFLVSAFHEGWVQCTPQTFSEMLHSVRQRDISSRSTNVRGLTAPLSSLVALHVGLIQCLRSNEDESQRKALADDVIGLMEQLVSSHETAAPLLECGGDATIALSDVLQNVLHLTEQIRTLARITDTLLEHVANDPLAATCSSLAWRRCVLLQQAVELLEFRIADVDKSPTQQPSTILWQEAAVAASRCVWAELLYQQRRLWQTKMCDDNLPPDRLLDIATNVNDHSPSAATVRALLFSMALVSPTQALQCVIRIPEAIWVRRFLPAWWERSVSLLRMCTTRIATGNASQHFGARVFALSASPNAAQREEKVLGLLSDRIREGLRGFLRCCVARMIAPIDRTTEGAPHASHQGELSALLLTLLNAIADLAAMFQTTSIAENPTCFAAVSLIFADVCRSVRIGLLAVPSTACNDKDASTPALVQATDVISVIQVAHIRALAKANRIGQGWFSNATFQKDLSEMVEAMLSASQDHWRLWTNRVDVRMVSWFRPNERAVMLQLVRGLYASLKHQRSQQRLSTSTESFQRVLWTVAAFLSWSDAPPVPSWCVERQQGGKVTDKVQVPPQCWWVRHTVITDTQRSEAAADWLQRCTKNV